MPIPVVICDDSSLARKQLARALPQGWDVSVTLAGGGREAIEAIRQGKGDILFLDLTMPEMDGFDVLEVIQREDLPTLTIVVSGDIQAESQRRVRQLGAVAFLKKPVDATELCQVLEEYGVLGILNADAPRVETQVGFNDWCQEMSNVAMGRAADLLAKLTEHGIELSIPRVSELTLSEIAMLTSGFSYVSQGFVGSGIAGETLVVFYDAERHDELARVLNHDVDGGFSSSAEVLMDLANTLTGAFLKGLSELLDVKFSLGQPRLQRPSLRGASLPAGAEHATSKILSVEIGYTFGSLRLRCDQLLLITEAAVPALRERAQMAVDWI